MKKRVGIAPLNVLGFLVACPVLLTGCGPAELDAPAVVVSDSAGVRIVEFVGPVDSASVDRLAIDPSWPPFDRYEFGDLVDVDVLPNGRAVMLDRIDARALVEDRDGELRGFGGAGEGPGEFTPDGLRDVVVTDSTILVPDLFQQRLSVFTHAGDLLSTWPYPDGGVYAIDWRLGPEERTYLRVLESGGDRIAYLESDTLADVFSIATGVTAPNELLSNVALWDVGPDGHFVATSSRWAVEYHQHADRGLAWIVRGPEPGEVSDLDRLHLEDLLVESAELQSGGRELGATDRAALLELVTMPKEAPALAGLARSADGAVWIREAAPINEMGVGAMRVGTATGYGGELWHVLDQTGSYAGSFRLPLGFEPTRFRDEWIYGIAQDESGVQRPVRLPYPDLK